MIGEVRGVVMRSNVVWGMWSEHVRGVVALTCALAGVLMCSLLVFPCVVRGGGGGSAEALLLHALEPPPIVEVPLACPGAVLPGSLGEVNAMTGDSRHLWVAENVSGRARTDEFSATSPFACERQLSHIDGGRPLGGVAAGHATGEEQVYVGYREGYMVVSNGESGVTLAEWPEPGAVSGVAVDNSPSGPGDWAAGDVLVAVNGSQHVVDVLKPKAGGGEEEAAPPLTGTGLGEPFLFPEGIAVDDANGMVFVVDHTEAFRYFIDVFEPGAPGEYRFVRKITETSRGLFQGRLSVAVDGSEEVEGKEGQLYVGEQGGGVDEFSLTGEFLGGITNADLQQEQPGASFGMGVSNNLVSVAVDPVLHHVFASVIFEGRRMVDGFGLNVVIPDVVTEPPSNVVLEKGSHLWSARMNGTVNPDDAGEAMCWFLWGTSESFGRETSCDKPVAEGGVPVGVQAELNELQPDTVYYYRLQAKNDNGTNFGEEGQDQKFTTPGPGLRSESVAEITSSSARFKAVINPHGKHTFYRFEYDMSPYGQGQAPHGVGVPGSGPVAIGSGGRDVEVEQHVVGLVSGGIYHYRVVAISEVEVEPGVTELVEFDGPDRTFTTQGRGGPLVLPDGRAWELVSPPDKRGAVILPIGEQGLAQASADGGAFTFVASAATEAQPQGLPEQEQVLSSRCDGVWSSKDIVMPHGEPVGVSIGIGLEYRFFSEDFSLAVAEPLGRFSPPEFEGVYEASPKATERTPYVRHNSICLTSPPTSTPYQPVVSGAPGYEELPPGTKFGGTQEKQGDVRFVGATPDAEHVVIGSEVPLTAGGSSAYEWSAGAQKPSERLQPLYLLPESEGGGVVNGGLSPATYNHQLSDDGSIFFENKGHLYLQDVARGVSVRLDVAQGVPEPSGANAGFLYASSDGSRVLFSDSEQLTSAPGGGVYECQVAEVEGRPACAQLLLTGLSGKDSLIGGSEDASYLYFVSKEALAPGSALGSCKTNREGVWEGSDCNLYVFHAGSTTFIAALTSEDSSDWGDPNGITSLAFQTSRVSPNGEWLAFMSDRSLTGYDNHDANSDVPDEEVYLYDAATGRTSCVSCDPTGARPVGRADELGRLAFGNHVWNDGRWLAANVPGWTPYQLGGALHQSRYLSDEGRLFFNSSDALVPQDSNGNEDVYEYEPVGVGSCAEGSSFGGSVYKPVRTFELEGGKSEEPAGCVALISSGVGFGESAFLDASETGGDVFFLTAERLVRRDVDTSLDVYDAHECTAQAPCPVEATSSPECITPESCRSAPIPQPEVFGAPASATFSGPGNLAPEMVVPPKRVKCKKPKKLSHGRCVESRKKARRARKASRVTRDRRSGR
jgi:hypothetical protein